MNREGVISSDTLWYDRVPYDKKRISKRVHLFGYQIHAHVTTKERGMYRSLVDYYKKGLRSQQTTIQGDGR